MSRHRDVRCMNYSDEYEGYDDIYGHSVEDDYCVSPSAEQFLFDRSKQQNVASFITEPDILEDNEDDDNSVSSPVCEKTKLSEMDMAKLLSCKDSIRNVIGDSVSESKLEEEIIQSNFNTEVALDKILKDASPKHGEDLVTKKENLDSHPDSAINILNRSPFVVPRFSLSQQLNSSKETSSTIPAMSEIKTSESISINSSKPFSSLAEMIASHTKSISKESSSNHKTKTQNFNSLADLTAHHLQKSNSLMNGIGSHVKLQSPNSGFIIPKLNIQQGNQSSPESTTSSDISIPNKTNIQMNAIKDVTNQSIDSIRKDLFNINLSSNSNTKLVTNLSTNSKSTMDNDRELNREPSPDKWLIDLSAALKEAEHFDSQNCYQLEQTTYSDNLSSLDTGGISYVTSFNDVDSELNVECVLNMSDLRRAKLPYIKNVVSPFGKVLCRKWRLRKPLIECRVDKYKSVKRFDFSTPYTRK